MRMLERFNYLATSRGGAAGYVRNFLLRYAIFRGPVRAAVWIIRKILGKTGAVHVALLAIKSFFFPEVPRNVQAYLKERERDPEVGRFYREVYAKNAAMIRPRDATSRELFERLGEGEALRILLLSDIGFQYGAGIALRRQASSLLLLGAEVVAVTLQEGSKQKPAVTGISSFKGWGGVRQVRDQIVDKRGAISSEALRAQIAKIGPDVLIVGNLHGLTYPLLALDALRATGVPVFAYMHDAFWVSGRCAAPLGCTKYLFGCDSDCPTANEYPRLDPDLIRKAWGDREQLFTGPNAINLIANSNWTLGLARQRFGERVHAQVVHLGLDHMAFAPFPRKLARQLLGVPDGRCVVLMGAVNVSDRWKGGTIFKGVHEALVNRGDVHVVLFGRDSHSLRAARSFGYVNDDRFMALIYSTADIFVSTAIAESFGQTLLEASACGLATVALNVGGVEDVVRHGETGLLVAEQSVAAVHAAVDELIKDQQKREAFGRAGRRRVEQHFTLVSQAEAWLDCIRRNAGERNAPPAV